MKTRPAPERFGVRIRTATMGFLDGEVAVAEVRPVAVGDVVLVGHGLALARVVDGDAATVVIEDDDGERRRVAMESVRGVVVARYTPFGAEAEAA